MNPKSSAAVKPSHLLTPSKALRPETPATPNDKSAEDDASQDLAWLKYETKLRRLVQELLAPTIKRSVEDRELCDEAVQRCEVLAKKLDELEVITHRAHSKHTVFDDIYTRINNLEVIRRTEAAGMNERIDVTNNKVQNLNFDYEHLKESISSMQDMTQRLSEDSVKMTIQLDEYKQSYADLVAKLQNDINVNTEVVQTIEIKVEEGFQSIGNTIVDLKVSISNNDLALVSTSSGLSELSNKLVMFEREVLRANATVAGFAQHIDSIRPLRGKIDELEQHRKTNENYLEKYLPFFVQAQISETLNSCLSVTSKNKLFQYEEKKFKDFNNAVLLDTGEADLVKRMQNIQVILESTFKRYSKALIATSLGIKYRDNDDPRTVTTSSRNRSQTLGFGEDRRRSYTEKKTEEKSQFHQSGALGIPKKGEDRRISISQFHGGEGEMRTEGIEGSVSSRKLSVENTNQGDKKSRFGKEKTSEGNEIITKETKSKEEEAEVEARSEPSEEAVQEMESELGEAHVEIIKTMQEEIRWLKQGQVGEFERMREEISSKIAKASQEQLEVSENFMLNIKKTIKDLERYSLETKKSDAGKELELSALDDRVQRNYQTCEKLMNFLKKQNVSVVSLIETVNSVLVLLLKEEKEKKNVLGVLQQGLNQSPQHGPLPRVEETSRRRSNGDSMKRSFDIGYLSGSKAGTLIEDRPDTVDLEIRLKYNDRTVKKMEFLELVFDNFKDCLEFSSASRLSTSFNQLLDSGILKPFETRKTSSRPARGGLHLLYNDGDIEKSMTLALKSPMIKTPFSRINTMNYKNYRADQLKSTERRKSPASFIREK